METKEYSVNIKEALGISKRSPYLKKYFDDLNARSSFLMSIIVVVLEVITIVYALSFVGDNIPGHGPEWLISHLSMYCLLFSTAAVCMVLSDKYRKHQLKKTSLWKASAWFFFVTCIVFGMFIGYFDHMADEQYFTFMTMEIFVICIIAWRPWISALITSISFIGFYALVDGDNSFSTGEKINYVTIWFAVMLISGLIYNQRRMEAFREDNIKRANHTLHQAAVADNLTGVANMSFFISRAREILINENPGSKIFLYLDIENFRAFNDKYGYDAGNAFLTKFAGRIVETFEDALVARQADDHFVVLTDRKLAKKKMSSLQSEIYAYSEETSMGLKIGGYVPHDMKCDVNLACDHARYACNSIKKRYDQDYCEYDKTLDEDFTRRQYIVNTIDTALDEGYVKVQYQPVVWAATRKLCGYEALAKWEDPKYGFISPGVFIPILEEYRQVHKLDMIVIETVCRDLRTLIDAGRPTVPVSLNFSRLDFELMDVVSVIEDCARKYDVPRNYLHVEVTESALSDYFGTLQNDLNRLRSLGYPLWLDDFGSGYSSLNVLKDYSFDVMKIDMKFLSGFDANPVKSKAVLSNVVRLATELGMHTLTEGVETKAEADYLASIGCERLQGYLFGKAMPLTEIQTRISAGIMPVSEEYVHPPRA